MIVASRPHRAQAFGSRRGAHRAQTRPAGLGSRPPVTAPQLAQPGSVTA
jgi:hypothetical protein